MSYTLQEIEPFNRLSTALIEEKTCTGGIIERTFPKDTVILHQDKEYESLYVLLSGSCFGEMADVSGKNMKIDDFYEGELIAAGILFSCDNRLPVSVSTRSSCTFAILDKKTILHFCMTSEAFLTSYMKLISDKVAFLSKKLLFISFKNIKAKVAGYLLSKIKEDKDTIVINQSLEELATYFGVARPSLSRVIADMQTEGLISHDKNVYTILDRSSLYKLI